jgi:hypothetical protein
MVFVSSLQARRLTGAAIRPAENLGQRAAVAAE